MGHIELSDRQPPHLAGVSKIITHKYFDAKTWNHDIALVKLREPLALDQMTGVNTVCLPGASASFEGHLCHVTGWGKVTENGSDSELLQKIAVPVIPYNDCYKKYESINPITPGMVCAGGDQPNKGPCVGDSGGPLQCRREDGAWVQIGVTSWGVGCARQNYPSVYVKISDYVNWIYFHLAKDYLAGLRAARTPRAPHRTDGRPL
ncbi:plasma kallikrein-like [Pollicipes pollicipes]|uniref:plasma kallikrein-like n=1 Tax=Pollicipes pollicipes TaxID=41117 RepID=UPI00188522D0|nr:plasma kallikrein-like [Pollicipes pollicipes]